MGLVPAVDLIVERIQQHRYAGQYDIIGCLPNVLGADPADTSINSTSSSGNWVETGMDRSPTAGLIAPWRQP